MMCFVVQENTDKLYNVISETLPSVCTIIVAIISSVMVILSSKKSQKLEKAEKLQKHLEDFYYPFLLHSNTTSQLYKAFQSVMPADFYSSLVFLLEGKDIDGNASSLFKQIILNNKYLNELILKYSFIINNKTLRDDLAKLSTHYTLLALAYDRKIYGNVEQLKKYIFDFNIIENIEAEINLIEEKITKLSR